MAVVDLGKTSCRLQVLATPIDAIPLFETTSLGAPGLSEADGVNQALRSLAEVLGQFSAQHDPAVGAIVIGAAGASSAPKRMQELAEQVARLQRADVAVCSDAVIAHVGALNGEAGSTLVVGTGAVSCTLAPDGAWHQADGWGPWLGDEGSGRWIGQHGLQAALRGYDGRGPHTSLIAAASALTSDLHGLPVWLATGASPARRLAEFAPTVLDHAAIGDEVAAAIVSEATHLLARTAAAGQPSGGRVAVVGGLTDHPYFFASLASALEGQLLTATTPHGNPLAGGRLIAAHQAPLHEGQIVRVSLA